MAATGRRGAVTSVGTHVSAEVIASRRAGAYRQLTLVAPGVAEAFRPGTFLAVSVGEARLARRALWIHRVKPSGGYGATLDVVVDPVGPGTRWLAALPVGSRLEVTGPLGRPFALPKETARCLLVGEGYAAAPLVPLAERLRERECPVTLVIGAADEAHLLDALEARRSAGSVTVVTADGSVGERGDLGSVAVAAVPAGRRRVRRRHRVPARPRRPAAAEHRHLVPARRRAPPDVRHRACHGCPVPVIGDGGAEHSSVPVRRAVFRGDRVRLGGSLHMTDWANPVMVTSGCGGTGLGSRPTSTPPGSGVRDPLDHRRRRGPATTRRGSWRRPAGWSTPSASRTRARAFLTEELPWLVEHGVTVVVSVAGRSLGEYAELARRVGRAPGVSSGRGERVRAGRRRQRGLRRARAVPRGRRGGRRTP